MKPITVACPKCGVPAHKKCVNEKQQQLATFHKERKDAAALEGK